MDSLSSVTATSPDGQWVLSVRRDSRDIPMLTLSTVMGSKPQHLLYVQRSGWVLWSPDSARFAFTDAAFANHYFIRICTVRAPRARCENASPALETHLRRLLTNDSEIDKIYAKALKWLSPAQLLVGIHAATFRPAEARGSYTPVYYHFKAYVLDLTSSQVVSELDSTQAELKVGGSLESLEW